MKNIVLERDIDIHDPNESRRDLVGEAIEALRRQREELAQRDLTPPPAQPSWLYDDEALRRTEWRRRTKPQREELDLDTARGRMREAVYEYIDDPRGEALILVVPPAVGKTHIAVRESQELAVEGRHRILYAMPRHEFYYDGVQSIAGQQDILWHHWLPINDAELHNPNLPTTCKYFAAMNAWTGRGYPAMALCDQLCPIYQAECVYRRQAKTQKKVIAGQHAHVVYGMAISDFYAAFIDELPLTAFFSRRDIPLEHIVVDTAEGPIKALLETLMIIAQDLREEWWHERIKGKSKPAWAYELDGKALLDQIGPILSDVFRTHESIGNIRDHLPEVPWVETPADVYAADYYYVLDMFKLLQPEWTVWQKGWADWLRRVAVTPLGLRLYQNKQVWRQLPERRIILDATGKPSLYRQIFEQDVRVVDLAVERKGRVFQIANRINSVGGMAGSDGLTRYGEEVLQLARLIAGRYTGRVGVITHKACQSVFAEEFGADNVMYFYGTRGSNKFLAYETEDGRQLPPVEALIVAGGALPNMGDLINQAIMLYPERLEPFYTGPENDDLERDNPLWAPVEIEYRLKPGADRPEGVDPEDVPVRRLNMYPDPVLRELLQVYCRDEHLQAGQRARQIINDADVWFLTAYPTGMELDGWWDNPAEALGTGDIPWKHWIRLQPWLGERYEAGADITVEDIAEFCGVSTKTVYNGKWMDAIYAAASERWQIERITSRHSKGWKKALTASRTGE